MVSSLDDLVMTGGSHCIPALDRSPASIAWLIGTVIVNDLTTYPLQKDTGRAKVTLLATLCQHLEGSDDDGRAGATPRHATPRLLQTMGAVTYRVSSAAW